MSTLIFLRFIIESLGFFFFLKTSTRNFTVKEKRGKVKAEGGFKQNLRVRGGNCSRIKAKAEV